MEDKEFIISFKKIFKNFARLWWIIPVSLVVGIIVVMAISRSSEKKAEEACVGITRLYVYYVKDDTSKVEVSENDSPAGNYSVLANTETVRAMVNEKLKNAGLKELSQSDKIKSVGETRNVVHISVNSTNDKERIRIICDALAESIASYGQSQYSNTNAMIIDKTHIEPLTSDDDESGFSAKKKLIIAALFVCVGIFVICMSIAFDTKVYVKEEVPGKLRYLGTMGKKGMESAVTTAAVNSYIKSEGYKSVYITTPGKVSDVSKLDAFSKEISCDSIEIVAGVEENADAIVKLNEADAVIVYIMSGKEKSKTIDKMASRLVLTKANVIGYVLAE